LEKYF